MTIPIVVTTINLPTDAVQALCEINGTQLLVVGDKKTPAAWRCGNARFFSVEEQLVSRFSLSSALPFNHYCRKNVGYLEAFVTSPPYLAETDDDNFPTYWDSLGDVGADVEGTVCHGSPWVNIYPHFTDEIIWPRGFPLDRILRDQLPLPSNRDRRRCSIQQFLAEGDPDVDAIYRLTVGKSDHEFKAGSVILDHGALTTFNSQSTLWFPEAYVFMYLPSYVSFRMTDIWRSLVAQVCIWPDGGHLAYHGKGVTQVRNEHDLMRDFRDEVPGYEQNEVIAERLLSLSLPADRHDRLRMCYEALHDLAVVNREEIGLVERWLADLTDLGIH